MTSLSVNPLLDCFVGWLAGWLVGWLVGWWDRYKIIEKEVVVEKEVEKEIIEKIIIGQREEDVAERERLRDGVRLSLSRCVYLCTRARVCQFIA